MYILRIISDTVEIKNEVREDSQGRLRPLKRESHLLMFESRKI